MKFQQVSLELEKLSNGDTEMNYPPDHGLPLVQLKERRRELVVALKNRKGEIDDDEMRQIAVIQQAISAFEDVIADLDCEQMRLLGTMPIVPSAHSQHLDDATSFILRHKNNVHCQLWMLGRFSLG